MLTWRDRGIGLRHTPTRRRTMATLRVPPGRLLAARGPPRTRPRARARARGGRGLRDLRALVVRFAAGSRHDVSRFATLAMFGASAGLAAVAPARAEFSEDREYMPSLEGKDYGKSKYSYPDFVQLPDGLQYKTMKEGTGAEMTEDKKAVIDWDGYTLGYYGRPFEARNKSKGGAFTGDDKDYVRFTADDPKIIGAFREAVIGMKAGEIRRLIVPGGSELSYPQGRKWTTMGPQPSNFSGQRALGFVLENEGMIDKTLLFDIELIRVDDR